MSESPLHLAVIENRPEKIPQLLEYREVTNKWGLTPLDLARWLDRNECLQLLDPPKDRWINVVRRGATNTTEYRWDEFEKAFGVRYLRYIKFGSYQRLKEVLRNCPLLMRYTSWGDQNREWGESYQQELDSGYVANVTIRWIDEIMGYGVFTEWDLEPGTYVGEYTGLVRRFYRLRPDHNAYCFHYPTRLFSLKYFMVDAEGQGNELRFINHSDQPNLEPFCLYNKGLCRLGFQTSHYIPRGTELTFNYGTDYWRRREKVIHQQSDMLAYQRKASS